MLDQAYLITAVDSFMERQEYEVVKSITEKRLDEYRLRFSPDSWAHRNIGDDDLNSLIKREQSEFDNSNYKSAFCEYRDNRLAVCE